MKNSQFPKGVHLLYTGCTTNVHANPLVPMWFYNNPSNRCTFVVQALDAEIASPVAYGARPRTFPVRPLLKGGDWGMPGEIS